MSRRAGMFLLAMFLVTRMANSQNVALEPMKPIGVGWQTDKWGWMSFVSFSSDGKQIASDGATDPQDVSQNLSFWSFPEGRLVKKIPVMPTKLSPDWKYYATFHGVGEVGTGKSLISLRDREFAVLAFSPDSHYVAGSLANKENRRGRIHVIELPGGKQVNTFSRYAPSSLAISPDGLTLAAGHWDIVVLWNMLSGKRVGVIRGFGRYVRGLSFSGDGEHLAAGSDTGAIQIWDVHSLTRMQSIQLDGGDVSDPAFSPDGRLVAFGIYGTGTVWLIDLRSGKALDRTFKSIVSACPCGQPCRPTTWPPEP